MLDNLYRCVVEDNKDPKALGRVRIRVIGVHDKSLENLPTASLPWSDVLSPVDSGGGFGSSINVIQGVWGYCIALNDTFTEFLFIGVLNGNFDSKPPETDANGDAVGFRDPSGTFPSPQRLDGNANALATGKPPANDVTQPRIKVGKDFSEPADTSRNAQYPMNKVYEDQSGNIMEIDGTSGNNRFRFQHSSGSRIEISKDGAITINSINDIWMKGHLIVQGTMDISGDINSLGAITAVNNISSQADVIGLSSGSSVSLTTHRHTEQGDGQPVSPPIP